MTTHAPASINTFFTHCVAHAERKFWIARTYEHLVHAGLLRESPKIPRALTQAPYLHVVAAYRAIESRQNRSVSTKELAQLFTGAMPAASASAAIRPPAP